MLRDELAALLEPLVRGLGYELWELEVGSRQGGAFLRLFIDQPGGESAAGITVDDCARVSHAVSEVMDAEEFMAGHYTLEVSSPGLDRVLRTQAHFGRFVGEQARVEMRQPVGGRKRFTGRLRQVTAGDIVLDLDAKTGAVTLPIAGVHKARLIPNLKPEL